MIGVGMIALAMALAYSAWCWRDEKRAARTHEIANLVRSDDTLKRATSLMERLLQIRQAAEQPTTTDPFWCEPRTPFPAEGDNFTTLGDANIARPEFGKRPRTTDTPDGVA